MAALLPELLELSVHLPDAVRFPGSTMRGSITISVPSRQSLQLLANHSDVSHESNRVHADVAAHESEPSWPRGNDDAGSLASISETAPLLSGLSPSPLALAPLLLQPLARPFPFELRVQLMAKCVYDSSKLFAPAMKRFAGHAPDASAFRLWSTRVVAIPVDSQPGAHMPRTYEFRVPLPDNLPASFRGVAIKHVYFLNVLAIRDGRKIADVKIPFRVRVANHLSSQVLETPSGLVSHLQHCLVSPLSMPPRFPTPTLSVGGAAAALAAERPSPSPSVAAPAALLHSSSISLAESRPIPSDAFDAAAESRPLLSSSSASVTPTATAAALSQPVAPLDPSSSSTGSSLTLPLPSPICDRDRDPDPHPLAPLTFNISKGAVDASGAEISGHVVRVTLDNRFARPGDTVRGHLDFSGAALRCYRLTISLEQEERVQEEFAPPVGSSTQPFCTRKSFGHFHSYTVNTLSTHFTFSLPLDGVANFATDVVCVSWLLRFQFIVDVDAVPRPSWPFLPAPSSTRAESLQWTLPLTVLPHDDEEVVAQKVLKTMLFSPQPCA